MTLIIGAIDKVNKKVIIGSDGQASSGSYYFDSGSKLVRVKNFIVGFTVSYRFAQLLQYNQEKFNEIHSEKDIFDFAQALKQLMIDNGAKDRSSDSGDLNHPVGFLLATEIGLFDVESNYQFHKVERWAVGSGMMYGMGYFDGSKEKNLRQRIKNSIQETSKIVPSVGGSITIKDIDLEAKFSKK